MSSPSKPIPPFITNTLDLLIKTGILNSSKTTKQEEFMRTAIQLFFGNDQSQELPTGSLLNNFYSSFKNLSNAKKKLDGLPDDELKLYLTGLNKFLGGMKQFSSSKDSKKKITDSINIITRGFQIIQNFDSKKKPTVSVVDIANQLINQNPKKDTIQNVLASFLKKE